MYTNICSQCNNLFQYKKKNRGKYCSKECFRKYLSVFNKTNNKEKHQNQPKKVEDVWISLLETLKLDYENGLYLREIADKYNTNISRIRKTFIQLGITTRKTKTRRNPTRKEYVYYRGRVHHLTQITYQKYQEDINPHNLPRTLCGIDGGFQLDHVISIREGFLLGLLPEALASKENLQMLPWKENLAKR